MWKRVLKNKFGKADRIYKNKEEYVYDALPEVKYTVEYLPVKHREAAEKAELRGSEIEPLELRDFFETDSLGSFLQEIMIRLLDPETEDLWPFMEVNEKDTCMEIPGTLKHTLRNLVNADLNRKVDATERQITDLTKELETMTAFIKQVHAEDMYREFKEGRER